MQKVGDVCNSIMKIIIKICITIFFLATILTFINVLLRKIFNSPISGIEELDNLVLVMIVFMTIPYLELTDRHLNVSIVYDKFPEKVKFWVDKFKQVFTLVISILLSYSAWAIFLQNIEFKLVTPTMGIPLYIPYFILFFGFAFASIANLVKIFKLERV